MSDEGVKHFIGRLMTDDNFKNDFVRDPKATLEKSGYDLDEDEIEALSQMSAESLEIAIKRKDRKLIDFGFNH